MTLGRLRNFSPTPSMNLQRASRYVAPVSRHLLDERVLFRKDVLQRNASLNRHPTAPPFPAWPWLVAVPTHAVVIDQRRAKLTARTGRDDREAEWTHQHGALNPPETHR